MILLEIATAIILDYLIGDPQTPYHPVALIGRLIKRIESLTYTAESDARLRIGGIFMVILVLGGVVAVVAAGLMLTDKLPYGVTVFSVLCYWIVISPRSLALSGVRVGQSLTEGNLQVARRQLRALVGRDTNDLNSCEISRAAIESIAENVVDGITAPLFYAAIGGPILAVIYRVVNTMDSMIGYKNDRYREFGWAAARLDDLLNYIPARLTKYLLVAAALISGKNWRQAITVSRRDGRNHASPNSGISQAAVAGALGIRLGGIDFYHGEKRFYGYIGSGRLPDAYQILETVKMVKLATLLIIFLLLSVYLAVGSR